MEEEFLYYYSGVVVAVAFAAGIDQDVADRQNAEKEDDHWKYSH